MGNGYKRTRRTTCPENWFHVTIRGVPQERTPQLKSQTETEEFVFEVEFPTTPTIVQKRGNEQVVFRAIATPGITDVFNGIFREMEAPRELRDVRVSGAFLENDREWVFAVIYWFNPNAAGQNTAKR